MWAWHTINPHNFLLYTFELMHKKVAYDIEHIYSVWINKKLCIARSVVPLDENFHSTDRSFELEKIALIKSVSGALISCLLTYVRANITHIIMLQVMKLEWYCGKDLNEK
jgi:hypothetical protein